MKKISIPTIGLIAAVLFILVVIITATTNLSHLFAEEIIGTSKPPVKVDPAVNALNKAFVEASDAVLPVVVSISVEIETKSSGNNQLHDQFKEFFEFFGQPMPQDDNGKQRAEGSGSGVLISENGYIITNNHVVENATSIKVTTFDKKEHKATLVGRDPMTDLAVIKIEGSGYPTVHFANIEQVKIGEWVIAVGNPFGLTSTVTAGIVSAIGRGGLALSRSNDGYSVENFIQTDAAINPGNSGGGLFNLEGSLVGINTAIATRTGAYNGYGFAIPVDLVHSVALDLIDDGKINRGYIGVIIRSVDELMARKVGLDKVEGAVVHDVLKNSPAEKSDIEPGDIILEVDGTKVSTSNELQSSIVMRHAGDKVNITIWRNGERIIKNVKLEPRDDKNNIVSNSNGAEKGEELDVEKPVSFDKLGFSVEPLSDKIKENLGVDEGVFVSKVNRFSNAESRGLTPNGVISKVDGENIKSCSQLKRILEDKKQGDVIMMNVKYKESNRIVVLEIGE